MVKPVNEPASLSRLLVLGARPRTLPAAVVPVMVGAASVEAWGASMWWRAALAMVVSVALQVAVNYANDYSDGIRGTDDDRVGPIRLVGSGLVPAATVKKAAIAMLALAAVCGLVLAAASSWWVLLVGAVAMVSAWTYTGGPRPYGYAGFGELFVFVFFGVVATVGTQFVVSRQMTAPAWWASVAVGCFACALLVVNNLRDRPTDAVVGKRTLAVKMGDAATRVFFIGLFVAASVTVVVAASITTWWALLALAGPLATAPANLAVARGAAGRDLVAVLGAVGRAQLILGVGLTAGLLIGR